MTRAAGRAQTLSTGPNNRLLDTPIRRHCAEPLDAAGAWAASGKTQPQLLDAFPGMPGDRGQAAAFAWLAGEILARRPGNLPAVTDARRESS